MQSSANNGSENVRATELPISEDTNQLVDGVANMMCGSQAHICDASQDPPVMPIIKNESSVLITPCASIRSELNNVLNANVIEVVDDEMTIIIGKHGFGNPFNS